MADERSVRGYTAPDPGCVGGARGSEVGVKVKEIVYMFRKSGEARLCGRGSGQ